MHFWLTDDFIDDDMLRWSSRDFFSVCFCKESLIGDSLVLFENLVDQECMTRISMSQLNLSLSFWNDVRLIVIVFFEPLTKSSDRLVKLSNIYRGSTSELVQMFHQRLQVIGEIIRGRYLLVECCDLCLFGLSLHFYFGSCLLSCLLLPLFFLFELLNLISFCFLSCFLPLNISLLKQPFGKEVDSIVWTLLVNHRESFGYDQTNVILHHIGCIWMWGLTHLYFQNLE